MSPARRTDASTPPEFHSGPAAGSGPAMGATAPAMVPTEDLEAAIAELPAKKDALRGAFDRLAACSPYPLPFTWEELDAHVSSISRRFRQLRVLEATRPAHTGKNQEGDKDEEVEEEVEEVEEEEEVEEVEVVEEEEEEEEEGEEEEEVEEEEEEEVVEEEEEEEVEEEEVVEEEEEVEVNEEAEKEMQDANCKIGDQAKDNNEGSKDEERDANEEAVATEVSAGQGNEAEGETQEVDEDAQEDKDEEQDTQEEMVVKLTKKQLRRLPPGGNEDLVAACERMDAKMLVKFVICVRITLKNEFLVALHHAPDPAALVLQVAKLFLSSKKFKSNKVWEKCVGLIRCLSMVSAKHSCCLLGAFFTSSSLIALYLNSTPMRSSASLLWPLINARRTTPLSSARFLGLQTGSQAWMSLSPFLVIVYVLYFCSSAQSTLDLIDYLIGNGQYLEVFYLAHVFKLKDKYPLLSLLKGCVEKAKQTAMEIFGNNTSWKSLQLATSKEVRNLQAAHHLAKQKIADSSQSSVIMAEIENLLGEYAKKRISACPSTASTWNPQCNPKKHKQRKRKRKKEEHHEGQESQQQPEQNQSKLIQGKQHQQISKKIIHN